LEIRRRFLAAEAVRFWNSLLIREAGARNYQGGCMIWCC